MDFPFPLSVAYHVTFTTIVQSSTLDEDYPIDTYNQTVTDRSIDR